MTEQEIIKLKGQLESSAKHIGFIKESEDIAQQIFCNMLEGKHQKASYNQAIVDVLRKDFGRKGLVAYTRRQALNLAVSFEANDFDKVMGESCEQQWQDKMDYQKVLALIKKPFDKTLVLHFFNGYSQKEIAEILDCSENYISHRLHKILHFVRFKLNQA